MTDFQTPVDIANRGLQYLGASRITSFTQNSKNAAAMAFVYDKLREAELRRNIWKFSLRSAILRAIDTDTRLLTLTDWSVATAYITGDIVVYAGRKWITPENTTGDIPGEPGTPWLTYAGPQTVSLHDPTIAYGVGELVYVASVVYLSLTSANDDPPPTSNWHVVQGATPGTLTILEPTEERNRFLFMLPASYLRYAPDPKSGAFGALGGPTGTGYQDINFVGRFLSASDPSPIYFRFAADITDVTQFDPLFCEGLAARSGVATCEELTQSASKLTLCAQQYKQFMSEARIVNAIETGPVEPAEDDYISVRY